jgi:hypothetical protein
VFRFNKLSFAVAALSAGLFVAGCTANNKPAESPLATTAQGVTCSKCEVTWVKVPETAKGRVVGYTTRKSHVCPDCKDAVANFFATGKFQHTCKTCGDSMEICDAH